MLGRPYCCDVMLLDVINICLRTLYKNSTVLIKKRVNVKSAFRDIRVLVFLPIPF